MNDDKLVAMAAVGLRYFSIITRAWSLTRQEQIAALGAPDAATYDAWITAAARHDPVILPETTLERLCHLMAIYDGPKGEAAGPLVRSAIADGLERLRQLSSRL